jgi:pyruvate dehydrogenase E2 component (dihydrolipoamide acetyltransferase)
LFVRLKKNNSVNILNYIIKGKMMGNYEISNPYSDNEVMEEIILKGTRKVIADHLMDSYRNKIHASMSKYIEVNNLIVFKEKVGKGSLIDYFYRAVALSLQQNLKLNATYDGNVYKTYKSVNLSMAVNASRGLVTPVLKNADSLPIDDFIEQRKKIISLALDWKHKVSDIIGGTFTITNLGSYGIDFLSPIINPPQVAIMGIGRMCKLNISWNDFEKNADKQLLPVSLTYDHSVIDGAGVAAFLQILQELVFNPEKLWS